jgi:hypothetical protein
MCGIKTVVVVLGLMLLKPRTFTFVNPIKLNTGAQLAMTNTRTLPLKLGN